MKNYGIPLTEYYLTIELSQQVRCSNNEQHKWQLPHSPYIKLITFNRNYDSNLMDYKTQKLDSLLKKAAPIELASGLLDLSKQEVTSSLIYNGYLIYLRDAIGSLFDVRKFDLIDTNVYLTGTPINSNFININNVLNGKLIWTSYSLKLYQRPYISNKHWENIPKFKLIKTIPFTGDLKKIDLSKEESIQHTCTPFPKNLFDYTF